MCQAVQWHNGYASWLIINALVLENHREQIDQIAEMNLLTVIWQFGENIDLEDLGICFARHKHAGPPLWTNNQTGNLWLKQATLIGCHP